MFLAEFHTDEYHAVRDNAKRLGYFNSWPILGQQVHQLGEQ